MPKKSNKSAVFWCTGTFWNMKFAYSRLSQVNNSPRANVFPAGEANFCQAMYRSLESSTQDTRDGFDLYSARASFARPRVDLARLLRRAVSRPFRTIFSEFVKVCGVRFSTRESLIGFCIWCHPISTILACLFSVGVRGQKLCWKGIMAAKMASRASYLVYYYRRTATWNLFVKQSKFHWPFFNIS